MLSPFFAKPLTTPWPKYQDEVRAFKTAWTAVKHEYVKGADGVWIKK